MMRRFEAASHGESDESESQYCASVYTFTNGVISSML